MTLNEAKELFPSVSFDAPENAIGYIYVTIEVAGEKFYIGKQTRKNWDKKYFGSGKNPVLWIKEGLKLEHWPIQWCYSRDELNQAEYNWIDKFRNHPNISNMIDGGPYGFKSINEKVARERSINKSGEKNPFYGHTHTPETKEKLSEYNRTYNWGENNPFYGRHHTDKTKQIISKKNKEYNKIHGNSFKGHKHTNES